MRELNKEKGFTLLEIVGVLAILSVLLYALVSNFGGVFKKVDRDVVESDLRSAKTQITGYYINKGALPVTVEDVREALGFEVSLDGEMNGVLKYKSVNKTDVWGNNYVVYVYAGDATNFAYFSMVSKGPDGELSGNIEDIGDDIMYLFYPTK